MDQMLLTTGIIIIYVLYPVIVFDKFLLNSIIYFIYLFIKCCDILTYAYITLHNYLNITVDSPYVYNPRLFHSFDLIIKSL